MNERRPARRSGSRPTRSLAAGELSEAPASAALEALHAATQAIAEELDPGRVLQLIADRVRDLVAAGYAAIGIVDAHGRIERFITSGISPEARARIGAPPQGLGLLGLIIRRGRSYRIADIAAHPDSSGFPPNHPPMRSFLGVPVMIRGRPVGNLYLTDKVGAAGFSRSDEGLVEMFAAHAGVAIENARLYDQVERLAVVDERDRIGRDLHDGTMQGLYAVALSLEDVPALMAAEPEEATARIDRAIDALNASIRDMRRFVHGLHAEIVEAGDLAGALAAIADEARFTSLVEVDLLVEPAAGRAEQLAGERRGEIVQVAREAMSNIVRHSRASRASLELRIVDDRIRLDITDDGWGFDPAAAVAPGHQGLLNLRERAALLGGDLRIESRQGAGTRIILTVPIDAAAPAPSPES